MLDIAPELLTRKQTATLLGVGHSHFAEMERSGGLGPLSLRIGGPRCVRYRRAELLDWIAAGCPARRQWQAFRAASPSRRIT